tara:strand:- start:345 stop:2573 length:2229 start_codon:yes stop_codon:yes gene_type:complete
MSSLQIGTLQKTGEPFSFDSELLRTHIALIGTNGSGKTVAAKALIEEATMAGIPSLIIDPQGDLGRLTILADPKTVKENGGDLERAKQYAKIAEVRIWTPTKTKGLPLCINPFKSVPEEIEPEDKIAYIDVMAGGFTLLAGFKDGQGKTAQVKAFLNELLSHSVEMKNTPADFTALADLIQNPRETFEQWGREEELKKLLDGFLKGNDIENLSRRIRTLDTGINKLMFSSGVPLDIDVMRTPSKEGLIPINIIHMKSLNDEQAQQTFLLEISRAIYAWMMTLDASKKDINLLYFIDEVAPYLPPHPYNPPAKNMIKLLFKQGRKYGVSCALATQNLKDVDYKILSQANTTLLGKVFDVREQKAVEPMLPGDSINEYFDILSSAKAGEFLFMSSNISERPIQIKTRWLYTEHGSPFNDEDVQVVTSPELREWANKLATSPELVRPVSKVSPQVNKAEDDSKPFVSEEETLPNEQVSMAEDGDLNVDENTYLFTEKSLQSGNEETVEINLLGGLSVLENTRDPLHMMLGLTNVITALAFLIVEISLFENWNEGRIPMIYPMLGLGLTILCGGVFIAESILKDHATLVKTVRERSRPLQLLVLVWAWLLFILPSFTDVEYSELTEACVIIAQTLVTLFFVADISHRFQLKRIDFEFGTSIFDAAKNSAKILIDAPHLRKIQASSEMLLRNIRMISDALAIYILLVLLEILPSLSAHGEYDVILRLFSIMCLNFVAELILRLRGND